MLAPHHGSLSSSSYTWLSVWKPQWGVFSAGFENRYHHPHPDIVNRYRRMGIQSFTTAESGALVFEFTGEGGEAGFDIREWRREYPRYWYLDYTDINPR